MVEFQHQSGTSIALDSAIILMCPFLPLLVFHRLLVLPWRPPSPLPPPPFHATPHLPPPPYLSTWTLPGSHYPEFLLSGSLVSPLESPFSATAVSPYIPHVSHLPPLSCPGKPLRHAPHIAPLFLHLVCRCPSKKSPPMVPNHLRRYLAGRGIIR